MACLWLLRVSLPVRVLTSWLLTAEEWALCRCVAGVMPNNLPQTNPESVKWFWSNLQSSKVPPACYIRPPPQKTAKSSVFMPHRRPLYRCVAGVEPNNLPPTELESVMRLWSNLPSSKILPAGNLSPPREMSAKS